MTHTEKCIFSPDGRPESLHLEYDEMLVCEYQFAKRGRIAIPCKTLNEAQEIFADLNSCRSRLVCLLWYIAEDEPDLIIAFSV